ncbi:hypothetical protein RAB80_018298 [Fusarium oxysporum f. sp. vasinfectum]|nr:hypothetical protein RAB80_018298 [Fusarium oxysporum f. sp. vasinfectum]
MAVKRSRSGTCPECKSDFKALAKHRRTVHEQYSKPKGQYIGDRLRCSKCDKEWSKKNNGRDKCGCDAEIVSIKATSTAQTPGRDVTESGSQDSGNVSGNLQASTIVATLADRSTKRQKSLPSIYFLCIAIAPPSAKDIAKDELLGVKVDLTDHEILETPLGNIINRDLVSRLKEDLGNAFVSEKNDELVLHQSVLTTSFAGAPSHVTSEIRGYDWFKEQVRKNSLVEHIQSKKASRVLLWVSNNTYLWPGLTMPKFYNHMRTLSSRCGNLDVCLSETEAVWEELKIGDIKAFDDIALNAPDKFSYRPRTCLGTGRCTLPPSAVDSMVVKRSHSCSASHVEFRNSSERNYLRCVDREERKPIPPFPVIDSWKPIWFHQERVTPLEEFGEFRIFFVKDKIMGAVRTRFKDGDREKNIGAQPVSMFDFEWFSDKLEDQEFKKKELFDFATYHRAKLLERSDSREHYRSLRVAVRIDIGVSQLTPTGRFFVLETPRIAGATLFSPFIFPKPHTEMIELLAKGLVEEYGA